MSQLGGPRQRVTLTTDLTKYHPACVIGAQGWTLPGVKCSEWGASDRFVAVAFDSGETRDILWQSLRVVEGGTP